MQMIALLVWILASGVNESFGNENTLWVDGRLYPLTDILFEQQNENCWSIRSLDERLNLLVETGWCRFENINLRLIGSQFNQWQAKVSGTIEHENVVTGGVRSRIWLLEQHYAKCRCWKISTMRNIIPQDPTAQRWNEAILVL